MMSNVIGVTIVHRDGILLQNHPDCDQWALPSTSRFPQETDFDAVKRLLLDKFEITPKSFLRPVITKTGPGLKGCGTVRLTCYLLDNPASIQLPLIRNHFSWTPPLALGQYPITEVDRQVIDYLICNGHLLSVTEAAA